MTNRKNTKRALFASVISMLLCVTMLVGSTFAWFTDTANTGVNSIQAGTLKIDIQDTNGDSLNGKTLSFVNSEGAVLSSTLWEPGCTYKLQEAKLVNLGNLALKFKVEIKGLVGDTELADVIDVKIGGETKGTLADLMVDPDGAAYGVLLPAGAEGDSASIGQIELHMQESAGNQYQGKTISGLAIFVSATQYTYEYDSNGNTYDANAEYAEIQADTYVSNTAELTDELANAEAGDVIALKSGTYTLSENLSTKGTLIIESNEAVTIELDGNKISSSVSTEVNEPTVYNYGDLTIEGGTISNKNATAGNTNVAAVYNASGELTLKNCTIENVAPTSGGAYAVTVTGGHVILDNCTVKGNRGGIAVSGDGYITMNGGSVSASVYYPLYMRGTGNSTFNGVTFTKLNNSKGKAITYNCFAEGEGTATFTGCTFKSETTSAVNLDISKVYTGFTFVDCTYTNVNEPA